MASGNILEQTASALKNDWGLQLPEMLSEDDIIKALAAKVVQLLEHGPEAFFQTMYRLDISEKKLTAVLNDEHVASKIARLIYDRQLQKMQSRMANTDRNQTDDPDLKW